MKKESFEKTLNGKKCIIYSESEKLKIIEAIDSGSMSVKEAQKQYGIHQIATVQGWLKQYSEKYRTESMRVVYTLAQKRTIVREIESGYLHLHIASAKYRVSERTLKKWLKSYSCGFYIQIKQDEMKNGKNESKQLPESHKKEIDELKLKIAGLDVLIDIAEQEFNIEIRKKSGTKQ